MSAVLSTATLEEFLDSFRMLGAIRLLVGILLLVAVIRMAKRGWIGGAKILGAGLGLVIVAECMRIMTQFQWISLSYSPSYASMAEEWQMEGADWERWEPVYWWTNFGAAWVGSILAAVGFVLAGRKLVERALQRDLAGGRMDPR